MAFHHGFWKGYAFIIVEHSGEDFVWVAVEQTDEGNPLLFVVLEPHHIAFKALWPYFGHGWRRTLALAFFFLLFALLGGNEHSVAAAVAIYGAAFASALPCFDIELSYELFAHIVWQVDGD